MNSTGNDNMKFWFFFVLFLCADFASCMASEKLTTKKHIKFRFESSEIVGITFSDPDPVLLPAIPALQLSELLSSLDELEKYAQERVEKCFKEIDNNINSLDSLDRNLLCSGFLASVMLESQTCISKPKSKKPPCVSRYRIIQISLPESVTFKKKYLEVTEYPVHPCRWHKSIDSYVVYKDGAILIDSPPLSEKSFWNEKPCGEDFIE